MPQKFDVSIVVPVYNVMPHITKCLVSLFDLLPPVDVRAELIIVDDCSTDASISVADSLLERSPSWMIPRIIRHAHNRGVAAARNTGISASAGTYVWFVDPDDFVDPDMLAAMWKRTSTDVDIVMTDVYMSDSSSGSIRRLCHYRDDYLWNSERALREFYAGRTYAFMWNKLVRRRLYEEVLFPEGTIYEDLAVMPVLLALADLTAYVNLPLYYYVQRAGSITSAYSSRMEDLQSNIERGVEQVSAFYPKIRKWSEYRAFKLEHGVLPIVNAISKLEPAPRAVLEVVRRTSRQVALTDVVLLLLAGETILAGTGMIVRFWPRLYMYLYRRFIVPRRVVTRP